jgi:hypothetical protein
MTNQLLNSLKAVGGATALITLTHFYTKLLYYSTAKAQENFIPKGEITIDKTYKPENIIQDKLDPLNINQDEMANTMNKVNSDVASLLNGNNPGKIRILDEEKFYTKFGEIDELAKKGLPILDEVAKKKETIANLDEVTRIMESIKQNSEYLHSLMARNNPDQLIVKDLNQNDLGEIAKSSLEIDLVKFYNSLYEFLDGLTLFQESAFLHILNFSVLVIICLNIAVALFGDGIFKYFKIESKFPSLTPLFKLRSLYQKYYLIWSIFLMFMFCILGFSINLFIFFYSV